MRLPALCLAVFAISACGEEPQIDTVVQVDPFVGTGGLGFAVGSITPAPTHPFGLAKPAPDTSRAGGAPGFSHCAGYWFEDDEIRMFSQIHLSGTGVPDYGVLGLMPVVSLPDGPISERSYRSDFDHASEEARLGYYRVGLESGVTVEISATPRTAVYRLTWPSPGKLVINHAHGLGGGDTLDGELSIAASEVSGRVLHAGDLSDRFGGVELFYVMRFDQPIRGVETFTKAARMPGVSAVSGPEAGAVLSFDSALVNVQIGLSFLSVDHARQNLDAEFVGWDLARAENLAVEAWRPVLDLVRVPLDAPEKDRIAFYTSLYHVFQMPTLFTEVSGEYRGVDRLPHRADGFTYYSDFSLWDTFRTLHPLLVLIAPNYQKDFNRSLIAMTEQGGHVPRWPLATGNTWAMIGSHGETMLIDSYVKGVTGFDVEETYDLIYRAANGTVEAAGVLRSGRECIESWLEKGYCPSDQGNGSASRTLENAYNDWLLGQMASKLGRSGDVLTLSARAGNWRNILDPTHGYLRGRASDGTFPSSFDEQLMSEDYTEGNARQWSTFVPHDIPGLAEAVGGRDVLLARLEQLFEGAAAAEKTPLPDLYYWHGNEPDIHAAFAFSELGRPDLSRKWSHWILDHRYDITPAGLDGNDDGGTLSAWYVFAALGIYPKVGTNQYYLGAPKFRSATVKVGPETYLEIRSEGTGDVDRIELDGEQIDTFITHEQLIQGGELIFYRGK